MKKLGVILSLVIYVSAHAADSSNPYKPTIPVTNSETGEGYLAGMPTEMKVQIIMAIRIAGTLEEAVKAIRALAESNKEFNQIINEPAMTRDLVHMLVAKFGDYHEKVALLLSTQGAKGYIAANKKFLQEWKSVENIEQVKALVAAGADINFSNTYGNTPLAMLIIFQAGSNKQAVAMVKYLMSLGANVNAIDSFDETLLFLAVARGLTDIVRVLLNSGLDSRIINMKDVNQNTVLSRAVLFQMDDIIELLLNAGADMSIQDRHGNTPLYGAREQVRLSPTDQKAKKVLQLLEQAEKDQKAKKQ